MSLIQEALEKAGKNNSDQANQISVKETPKKTKPPVVKVEAPQVESKKFYAETKPHIPAEKPSVLIAEQKKSRSSVRVVFWLVALTIFLSIGAAFYTLSTDMFSSIQQGSETNVTLPEVISKVTLPAAVKPKAVETRVPQSIPARQAQYKLNGITASGDERLALVNNRILGVGDYLKPDVMVEAIEEKRVYLNDNGREVILYL